MNRGRLWRHRRARGLVGWVIVATTTCLSANPRARVELQERQLGKRSAPKASIGQSRKSAADLIGLKIEKKLIVGITRTLNYLNKTVRSLPAKSKPRFEMMNKILNLHLEHAAYLSSIEQREYVERWDLWQKEGGRGRAPQVNNTESKAKWWQVYRTSLAMQQEFEKFPGMDLVIFNAALAQQYIGNRDSARSEFIKIAKNYPRSPVAGDAYFSLADDDFDQQNFSRAIPFYTRTLRYKRSTRYGWALFKLGWSFYNESKPKKAFAAWRKAVEFGDRSETPQGAIVKDEALRDIAYAFAELGQVDPAVQFYRRYGGEKYIPGALRLLATTFSSQGKFREAAATWRRLATFDPRAPEAFTARSEIVDLMAELRQFDKLWDALSEMRDQFGPGTDWANGVQPAVAQDAAREIEEKFNYFPKMVHLNAQKLDDAALAKLAFAGYRMLLNAYPNSPGATEVTEYMADILYTEGRFGESGKYYEKIFLLGPQKAVIFDKKGKIRENVFERSGRNMLDAYTKAFQPQLNQLAKLQPDFEKPPLALTPEGESFFRGCALYTKAFPRELKVTENCEVSAAEVHFRRADRQQAAPALWTLIRKHSQSKEGAVAVDNLIFMIRNDRAALDQAAEKILQIPSYRDSEVGKKLRDLKRGIGIEQIAAISDPQKRGLSYLNWVSRQPKDPEADKLLNNAGVDFLKAGNGDQAKEALERLVSQYPKSSYREAALGQLAAIYQDQFDLGRALPHLLNLAQQYPQSKAAPAALETACRNAVALESRDTVAICDLFLQRYPKQGLGTSQLLLDYLWRGRQTAAYAQVLTRSVLPRTQASAEQKVVWWRRMGDLAGWSSSQGAVAARNIAALGQSHALSGEALRYYGELLFRQVEPLQQKFGAVQSLRGGSLEALQASIEQNFQRVLQLEAAYQKVFQSGDSYWGIASFYNIGIAYEKFGELLAKPPPVNGVERQELIAQLADSLAQVQDKAKEYFTGGIQAMRQFSVYNEWSVKIYNALNRNMGRATSVQEILIDPDFLASEVPAQVRDEAT